MVAAGRGERLGSDRPKAFVVLAGRTLLERSVDLVRPLVGAVVVALPPGCAAPAGTLGVEGGATRSASVRNGLAAVPTGVERVVVHDAARPLAAPSLFLETLAALDDAEAAIAAAPVTDTIKETGPDGTVRRTLDRTALWAVQTPQAFRRDALARALDVPDHVLAAATDDAWLVERTGGRVVIVPSSPANLKITTPGDLVVAETLLAG